MKIKNRYTLNKISKVGATLICPSCNSHFIKSSYQQAFCKTKSGTICKDAYWNTVDPKKKNNTTRISPASKAFTERWQQYREESGDFDDDQSWDAHKSY